MLLIMWIISSVVFGGLALAAPTFALRILSLVLLLGVHLTMFLVHLRRARQQTKEVFIEALHQLSSPTDNQRQAAETLVSIMLSLGRETVSISISDYVRARDFRLVKELDKFGDTWTFRIERVTTATAPRRKN